MIQVTPLSNNDDALGQLQLQRTRVILVKGTATIEHHDVDGLEIPGADGFRAWEDLNEGAEDGRHYVRTVMAAVGRHVLYVNCQTRGEDCDWSDLVAIATAQAEKLHMP